MCCKTDEDGPCKKESKLGLVLSPQGQAWPIQLSMPVFLIVFGWFTCKSFYESLKFEDIVVDALRILESVQNMLQRRWCWQYQDARMLEAFYSCDASCIHKVTDYVLWCRPCCCLAFVLQKLVSSLCCVAFFFLAEGCKVRLGLMKWFRTWFCYALDLFELGEAWCVAHCERMLNISWFVCREEWTHKKNWEWVFVMRRR